MSAQRELVERGIDADQLLDFFFTYARLEYALKAAGFFRARQQGGAADRAGRHRDAEANWGAFEDHIHDTFRSDATRELRTASQYLLENPPHREVVVKGQLMWETRGPQTELPEVKRLLQCVHWVRNNLFHGAKFSPVHGEGPRNLALISASLAVLRACVAASPKLQERYEDAAL